MVALSPEEKCLLTKIVGNDDLPTSEVVELLASHSTLAKKLTCSHIANKCSSNTDLALLTANLLLKDAGDANPSVRSSSISALAALPGIEDSTVRAIMAALSDQAAQVRRAAAVACFRLFDHAPQTVLEGGLVDALYDSLRDSDPVVISNAAISLEMILKNEGGMIINKNIAHYLLGRLLQFSDCNAVYILSLLRRYFPKNDEELFLLLDALDELLLSKAPGVLMASVKLFLHWTKDHPHLKNDMLEVIQPPLCKILSRNIPETTYLILDFLKTLDNIRDVFSPHYKYFLVRAKDPGYLKSQKLSVLPLVGTESNVCSLIEEVRPFCSDYQSFKEAVHCLCSLASVSPLAYKSCLSTFTFLLDSPTVRVVEATLECLLNVLSVEFPESKDEEQNCDVDKASLVPTSQDVTEGDDVEKEKIDLLHDSSIENEKVTEACLELPSELVSSLTRALSRCSVQETAPSLVLHVLGALAVNLQSSPEILDSFHSSFSSLSEATCADIVTAASRVFLARPAQSQLLLASVLNKAFKAGGVPAARAALVYAALLEGPKNAASLLEVDVRLRTSENGQL
ncbi:hypothetical protein SK128_019563 [Halocaridina rubra]|uniref:Clathrin/coatomer adaptor adaptin-like N-terminal domain-containing protein n=1 Tax=Halocaridina rubra TaxID=373956 RepID=A0AAN8WRJ4_HALRR